MSSVLIVDDSKMQGLTLQRGLAEVCNEIKIAKTCEEGYQLADSADIIFVDGNIEGEMDGPDLIKRIKETYPNVLSVLYTAADEESVVKKIGDLSNFGINSFLKKGNAETMLASARSMIDGLMQLKNDEPISTPEPVKGKLENGSPPERNQRQSAIFSALSEESERGFKAKQYEFLNKRIDKLKDKVEKAQLDEVGAFGRQIEQALQQVKDLEGQHKAHRESIETLQKDLKSISNNDSQLRSVLAKQKKFENTITTLQDSVDAKTKSIDDKIQMVNDLKVKVNGILSQIKLKIGQVPKDDTPAPATFDEQALKDAIDQRFEALEHRVAQAPTSTHTKPTDSSANEDIEALKYELTQLVQSANTQQKDVRQLQRLLQEKIDAVPEVEQALEDSIGPIKDSLKETSERYKDELNSLRKKMESDFAEKLQSLPEQARNEVAEHAKTIQNDLNSEFETIVQRFIGHDNQLATQQGMEAFLNKRLKEREIYFLEICEEIKDETVTKSVLLEKLEEAKSNFHIPSKQVEDAIKNVAKKGLDNRVLQKISPNVDSIAQSAARQVFKGKILYPVMLSSLLGGVLGVLGVYVVFILG